MNNKPKFYVKKNLQKSSQTGVYFNDAVTDEVLEDVSKRILGVKECTINYVANDYEDEYLSTGYNKGRMAILKNNNEVSYISFSEETISGRNSSVQSVPTAFNMFYMNENLNKRLYYYFINANGNANTEYQKLIYRLMKTVGFVFLNEEVLAEPIIEFSSIDDIMNSRNVNSDRNKSNNSTYITKSSFDSYEVYGKTYGANKYETSLMCYAIAKLKKPNQKVTLYEVTEKDLKELPKSSKDVLKKMGNIEIVNTSMQLEKKSFETEDSLRSPRYIFNLLERIGPKHCALCNCGISELIQGAHVLPVAVIKKKQTLTAEEKLDYAIDGNNGIWLCQNHHRMFDQGMISFDDSGTVIYNENMESKYLKYIKEVTLTEKLDDIYLTDEFRQYLNWRRNFIA